MYVPLIYGGGIKMALLGSYKKRADRLIVLSFPRADVLRNQ